MDLVAIPSPSSISNRPVIEYAAQYFDPARWTVDFHPYLDPSGIDKVNLIATTHPGQPAELALVCHTDTVPWDPDWTEATGRMLRDGRIYGRGSCDVKGFLACVLAMLSRTEIVALKHPLAVILTADEEIGCIGAKRLASENRVESRYMVIGEPTSMRPAYAGKGYALAEILVRGQEAHSAFPARGRSAIRDAARVIERLDDVAYQLALEQNCDFDPPFTTLNAGLIQGGSAKNIVPGECKITVEWRPVPCQDPGRAATLIESQLHSLESEFPGFHADVKTLRLDPPFQPSAARHLLELAASLTCRPSTTLSFGTEAGHLGGTSGEVIVIGPGDMTVAHKSGEFVPIQELQECVNVLKSLIHQLCAQ